MTGLSGPCRAPRVAGAAFFTTCAYGFVGLGLTQPRPRNRSSSVGSASSAAPSAFASSFGSGGPLLASAWKSSNPRPLSSLASRTNASLTTEFSREVAARRFASVLNLSCDVVERDLQLLAADLQHRGRASLPELHSHLFQLPQQFGVVHYVPPESRADGVPSCLHHSLHLVPQVLRELLEQFSAKPSLRQVVGDFLRDLRALYAVHDRGFDLLHVLFGQVFGPMRG